MVELRTRGRFRTKCGVREMAMEVGRWDVWRLGSGRFAGSQIRRSGFRAVMREFDVIVYGEHVGVRRIWVCARPGYLNCASGRAALLKILSLLCKDE